MKAFTAALVVTALLATSCASKKELAQCRDDYKALQEKFSKFNILNCLLDRRAGVMV